MQKLLWYWPRKANRREAATAFAPYCPEVTPNDKLAIDNGGSGIGVELGELVVVVVAEPLERVPVETSYSLVTLTAMLALEGTAKVAPLQVMAMSKRFVPFRTLNCGVHGIEVKFLALLGVPVV